MGSGSEEDSEEDNANEIDEQIKLKVARVIQPIMKKMKRQGKKINLPQRKGVHLAHLIDGLQKGCGDNKHVAVWAGLLKKMDEEHLNCCAALKALEPWTASPQGPTAAQRHAIKASRQQRPQQRSPHGSLKCLPRPDQLCFY